MCRFPLENSRLARRVPCLAGAGTASVTPLYEICGQDTRDPRSLAATFWRRRLACTGRNGATAREVGSSTGSDCYATRRHCQEGQQPDIAPRGHGADVSHVGQARIDAALAEREAAIDAGDPTRLRNGRLRDLR